MVCACARLAGAAAEAKLARSARAKTKRASTRWGRAMIA